MLQALLLLASEHYVPRTLGDRQKERGHYSLIYPHPLVDRPGPRRRAREAGRAHALAWRVVGAANLADSFAVLALSIVDCPHRFCTYGM